MAQQAAVTQPVQATQPIQATQPVQATQQVAQATQPQQVIPQQQQQQQQQQQLQGTVGTTQDYNKIAAQIQGFERVAQQTLQDLNQVNQNLAAQGVVAFGGNYYDPIFEPHQVDFGSVYMYDPYDVSFGYSSSNTSNASSNSSFSTESTSDDETGNESTSDDDEETDQYDSS